MRKQVKTIAVGQDALPLTRRRALLGMLGLGFLLPLMACGERAHKRRNFVVLDVEMFSYIDRYVTDIEFDGTFLGLMNRYGGTGIITNVRIPFGVQTLSWTLDGPEGTPRNCERVEVKNSLMIKPEQISPGVRALGLHLYPDDTAEITFAEVLPERTARGRQILAGWK